MLNIRMFGGGQARYFDRTLVGFPTQQACLVFCYLLLNKDHPHYRERLAAVFWEDYPAQKARKYLRNALWRLRQILETAGAPSEAYLWITDDSVSFINSSQYWLDVEVFDTITTRYQTVSGEALNPDQARELENATELYTGELLEGVYEDWSLYDRERYRIEHLNTLQKIMIFHGANNNFETGIQHGEHILALDPTQEKVHRQMMWLFWRNGDRNAALEQYKRCSQILQEELGMSPMKETQELYEQMVHNRIQSDNWPTSLIKSPPAKIVPGRPTQLLASRALQKLQGLRKKINEVNQEMHTLEQILNQGLADVTQEDAKI